MGILQRFKNIIRAKVNAKSSKTKKVNEEDLINKYIHDVKEALRQIKSDMAAVEANESTSFNKLCENEKLYEKFIDDLEKTLKKLEELKNKNSLANQLEKINEINDKVYYEQLGDFDSIIDKIQNKIYVAEAIAELNSQQFDF